MHIQQQEVTEKTLQSVLSMNACMDKSKEPKTSSNIRNALV